MTVTYGFANDEKLAQRLREKAQLPPDSTVVEGPCTVCGGTKRWFDTVGGGPYCSECLPPATRTLVEREEVWTESFRWMAKRRTPPEDAPRSHETPPVAAVDQTGVANLTGFPWAASGVVIRDPIEGEDEFDAQARRRRAWAERLGLGWQARKRTPGLVCSCGGVETVESPLPDGESIGLDCARCGRFMRFKRWKGRNV